jgi:hypothetical protein
MPAEPHLAALQRYTTERPIELPGSAKGLLRDLRAALVKASNKKMLATSPDDIKGLVQLLDEPPPTVLKPLQEQGLHRGAFCIVGGVKNQDRDPDVPHLKRKDRAWFDFAITVREVDRALVLLAYDFEIRLNPGMGAPFLRFDLNLPESRNDKREIRCHLHAGSDDILVPAPLMHPHEVLALFIEGVHPLRERKPRARTAFEQTWLEQTIAARGGLGVGGMSDP